MMPCAWEMGAYTYDKRDPARILASAAGLSKNQDETLAAFDLENKVLGIVELGQIGRDCPGKALPKKNQPLLILMEDFDSCSQVPSCSQSDAT